MSLFNVLMIIWAVLTTILVILLIYRSTLTIHEDDQLFIDQAESHMEQEQTALIARINRLQTPVRALATSSIALAIVMFGIWIWNGLSQQ